MTRKDYEIIAYAFKNSKIMILGDDDPNAKPDNNFDESLLAGWNVTVLEMALQLSKTNLRFDKDKFLQACGWSKSNEQEG
jgi:hypothetical protein